MTKALREAFEAASQLADDEQDAIAALVRLELEDERRWSSSMARSQDVLEALADAALDEVATGERADAQTAWASEIARRVDEVRSGTAELVDADQVHAEIRARLAAKRAR